MVYSIGSNAIYTTIPELLVMDAPQDILLKTEFKFPDDVPSRAKISGWLPMAQGYPVVPETAPTKMLWKHNTLTPADMAWGSEIKIVSDRFREFVEKFEPGVHQFIPVEFYRPQQTEPFARYYWFVVCMVLDSIDPDHTTWTWKGDYEARRGRWNLDISVSPPQTLVFSSAAIGDHHIWRDPFVDGGSAIYCSDAVGEALPETDLTGVAVSYREQV